MNDEIHSRTMILAGFRDDFRSRIGLPCRKHVRYSDQTTKIFKLVPTWKEIKMSESGYYDPAEDELVVSEEDAQVLMDRLWDCGLRPTEGKGSAGSLAATQEHLFTLKEYLNRMTRLVEADFKYLLDKDPQLKP